MPNPIPADLQATIAGHMKLFAGYTMTAVVPEATPPVVTTPPAADPDGDKPLGPNGEKALQAEREARKESDRKLAALEAQMTQVAEAFGVKPTGAKPDDNGVADLSNMVKGLLHTTAVDRVARESGITDKDDLVLLTEQPTEDAMRRLAARLKPATGDGKPATPKPDPSAGRGSGSESKTVGVSAGRDLFKSTHTTKTT